MVPNSPPATLLNPRHFTLPAGKQIFRVHPSNRPATEFKARQSDIIFGRGRFDGVATDDPFPYLYAGQHQSTAVAEVMLRSLPFDDAGGRLVSPADVLGRSLSSLTLLAPLKLVSLRTQRDLAAVGQDEWLVDAQPDHYPYTRAWGRYLRRCSDAAGFVWQSRRDRPHWSLILFGDRCGPGVLHTDPADSIQLDSKCGQARLNGLLARYRTAIGTW